VVVNRDGYFRVPVAFDVRSEPKDISLIGKFELRLYLQASNTRVPPSDDYRRIEDPGVLQLLMSSFVYNQYCPEVDMINGLHGWIAN